MQGYLLTKLIKEIKNKVIKLLAEVLTKAAALSQMT
jgi:hypothetical protein